ncbi:hypothetical protein MO973_04970 [Paenibacillus sp. TRM 82003]|nr:hypothetical protein [Paenibacillus sp. TRM 82003]
MNDVDFYLWRYATTDLLSAELTDFIYSVIIYPFVVLLFLSNFPEKKHMQLIHILKYIAIFDVLEFIALEIEAIHHANGWDMAWSTWFNAVTFCMLKIHHETPLVAYALSLGITAFLLYQFKVPLWDL